MLQVLKAQACELKALQLLLSFFSSSLGFLLDLPLTLAPFSARKRFQVPVNAECAKGGSWSGYWCAQPETGAEEEQEEGSKLALFGLGLGRSRVEGTGEEEETAGMGAAWV